METVYLETTIISYLTSRPSRDLLLAAQQQVTREWWERYASQYTCVTSDVVLREASQGDPHYAELRIKLISNLATLPLDDASKQLMRSFMATGALPHSMTNDAAHLAIATGNKAAFLLTWNCKHIANPHFLRRLGLEAMKQGWDLPLVCTPLDFPGGPGYVHE